MSETISLILLITSTVTFIGSAVLMFYNEKFELPVGEWVAFIFISFIILAREIINVFNPSFELESGLLVLIILTAIFILVVVNYYALFREYNLTRKVE